MREGENSVLRGKKRWTVLTVGVSGLFLATGIASTPAHAASSRTPSPPKAVTAVAGDGQVTVHWKKPRRTGGTKIVQYRVTSIPGNKTCTTGGTLSCTVKGLNNGTSYRFAVVAKNAAGKSSKAASTRSRFTPSGRPGSPRNVTVKPERHAVTVSWQRPKSDGGTRIVDYVVKSTPGNHTCVTTGTSCRVSELEDGIEYTFKVVARNAQGVTKGGGTVSKSVLLAPTSPLSASSVVLGGSHACVIRPDSTVACWGDNFSGQLGIGKFTQHAFVPDRGFVSPQIFPTTVAGLANVKKIAAQYGFTCALIEDGTVKCWGYNKVGSLGNGTADNSATPTTVIGIDDATDIAAGPGRACATLTDGTVKCWGLKGDMVLSSDPDPGNVTPITIPGIADASSVAIGWFDGCVTLKDGKVGCWDLAKDEQDTFALKEGLTGATSIAFGYQHACASISDGTVRCWGRNDGGTLGVQDPAEYSADPIAVPGIDNAVSVVSDIYGTCAHLASGKLTCWGVNAAGQFGDKNMGKIYLPTQLDIDNVASVTAGGYSLCATLTDTTVKCWGNNYYGQLGRYLPNTSFSATPLAVYEDAP